MAKITNREKPGIGTGIDAKDRQILYQLDLDSSQADTRIAKKVGLSRASVGYRIANLTKKGIIKGFYTVIDNSRLGCQNFRVYVKFQRMGPEKEEEFVKHLSAQKRVWWITHSDGLFDLGFAAWAKDVNEFQSFWEEVLKGYREHIRDYRLSLYNKLFQYPRGYLISQESRHIRPRPVVLGGGNMAEVDGVDKRILGVIGPNGRMAAAEVANRLGISPEIVRYRVKKLKMKGVVLGVKPMLNLPKLGYKYYKLNIYLRDMERGKELMKYVASHPNAIHIYQAFGWSDFEVGYEVKEFERFYSIVQDIRSKFSDAIEYYSYYAIFREDKISYAPALG